MSFWAAICNYYSHGSKTSVDYLPKNVTAAINFYKKYIYSSNRELEPLCKKKNFTSRIPSWRWEMLAALLVDDEARPGYGHDLLKHEVKSAQDGSAFEYQYHKNSWQEKLSQESQINHIYISYQPGYRNLTVRLIKGSDLADIFNSWRPLLEVAYNSENPQQRFRKSISFKTIKDKSKIILKIKDTQVVYWHES